MSRRHDLAFLSLLVGLAAGCADADQEPLARDLADVEAASQEASVAPQVAGGEALVDFADIKAIGSGCWSGTSWSVTQKGVDAEGNATATIRLRDFWLAKDQRFQTKLCTVSAYLNVKQGYKPGIARAEVVVKGRLEGGQRAHVATGIGFPGGGTARASSEWENAPAAGARTHRFPDAHLDLLPGSRCVQREIVEFSTAMTLDNPQGTTGLQDPSVDDGEVDIRITVAALPCGPAPVTADPPKADLAN